MSPRSPIPQEHHDVAVVVACEAQRRELRDRPRLRDTLEEGRQLGLAVLDALPRRDLDRRVGAPVDIVGALLKNGVHIPAAERLVDWS